MNFEELFILLVCIIRLQKFRERNKEKGRGEREGGRKGRRERERERFTTIFDNSTLWSFQ